MAKISPGIIVIVLLHLTALLVESIIIRRHYHDGILYEDYAADSDNVRFTNTKGEGWNDLDSLVQQHNLRGKSMFCTRGPGAWLLYQEVDYQYGSTRQLKLVYGEHCVAADNVKSIQPLGAVYANIEDYSAVITFTEKYFASKGETSRSSVSADIKSAIFVGTGNWTVEFDGKKVCVVVLTLGDVCLMEGIQNSFSATGNSMSISKGCSSVDTMEFYQLQTCFSKGFHELTYDFDFTLPSMQAICASDAYDAEDQTKNKFLQVVKLWNKRMNPPPNDDFKSSVQNAVERISTLNVMVTIMAKTCTGVSPSFLEIVKQIYLFHIKNGDIWNATETPDGTKIEQSHAKWSRAQAFISDCLSYSAEIQTGCKPVDISEMKNEKEVAAIEDFLKGESYDFVLEHVWLLLNYVSTYCNYQQGYINNDWVIFPLMFKRDFLYPLQEQWKHPDKWSTYYPLMFNGFSMEDERKAMISCVQGVIKETPYYDPLARPPSFYYPVNSTAEKDLIGGVTNATKDGDKSKVKRQEHSNIFDINENTEDEPSSEEDKTTTTTPSITTSPKTQSSVILVTPEVIMIDPATTTTSKSEDSGLEKIHKKKRKGNRHAKRGKDKDGKHGSPKILRKAVAEKQPPPVEAI